LGTKLDLDRLSHGKESISIDLKKQEGIEIVKNLAKSADVLIEPFRKGVMERLGLGPSVIFAKNPKIIYARLTGYGQTGELSEKAGHDINYISYAGVLSTFGRKNDKPYAPVNIVADFAGGGLMCALAILNSLYERDVKKQDGKVIDLSMVEGAAYLSSWLWSSRTIPGVWEGGKRGENLLDGGYAVYETYETKDGKFIASGGLEPAFQEQLLKGFCC
jgi:alpha-methylacyl-CoA racemase